MKSTCKNPELEIASWVICCNWFSCTNLNALQTLLVSAGRILTWIEEQLSSSVPSAGKAYLGPKSVPWLSPGWTRHSLAQSAAIPGLWVPQPPWHWGQPDWRAPRVSQGCKAGAVPALYHTYSAWPAALSSTCQAALQLGGVWLLPDALIHPRLYRDLFSFPFLYPNLPLTTPHSYLHLLLLILHLSGVALRPQLLTGRYDSLSCEQQFSFWPPLEATRAAWIEPSQQQGLDVLGVPALSCL